MPDRMVAISVGPRTRWIPKMMTANTMRTTVLPWYLRDVLRRSRYSRCASVDRRLVWGTGGAWPPVALAVALGGDGGGSPFFGELLSGGFGLRNGQDVGAWPP